MKPEIYNKIMTYFELNFDGTPKSLLEKIKNYCIDCTFNLDWMCTVCNLRCTDARNRFGS